MYQEIKILQCWLTVYTSQTKQTPHVNFLNILYNFEALDVY